MNKNGYGLNSQKRLNTQRTDMVCVKFGGFLKGLLENLVHWKQLCSVLSACPEGVQLPMNAYFPVQMQLSHLIRPNKNYVVMYSILKEFHSLVV